MNVERRKILFISGRNYKSAVLMGNRLRFVRDHFRCWIAHLELCAHFLDLRGLLFQLGRENFHSLVLLGDSGLQFLNLLVLFEELIE